ncbi:TPA: hypothetical protein ACPJ09_000944 [Vibrio diabolicus]
MANEFMYYWVVKPLSFSFESYEAEGFSILKTQDVVNQSSPLGQEGQVFFEHLHFYHGLYVGCLWVFKNTPFYNQCDADSYSDCFRLVGESLYDFKVSRPGFIIRNSVSGETITKQPPQLDLYQQCCVTNVKKADFKRLICLTNTLQTLELRKAQYFKSNLDYIRDIRNSPVFVSELALWSFVEHYWAENQSEVTDIKRSLKTLLEYVCTNKNEKREFNKLVRSVGTELGIDYNEHLLRNILAHGKYLTLKEKWSKDSWSKFYKVHAQLLDIVIRGIEKEVIELRI